MANKNKLDADPKEIQKAKNLWARFTVSVKYGVIATIAILALLGLITL